ncbi:MAG: glycosyltransferase [archaeon]
MQNTKSVALVMIVKNEELGLENAIKSAQPFVDEIVIAVDNSSQDKTLEIAKKYATTLKVFDWNDNFAEARNFAQAGVKSDWLLFLDGHEIIEKCEKLQDFLNMDCDALICTVEMENKMRFRNPRIYKNGLTFDGAVHECQNPKHPIVYPHFLVKHNREKGQSTGAIELRDKQRDEQTPRIFGERLKKNKRDLRALFHLAAFYQAKFDFKKALKFQKQYLKYSTLPDERWFVYFNRAQCFLAIGKIRKALKAVDYAEKEMPGRWETAKIKGIFLFQRRKFEKAMEYFVDSFKNNKGYIAYVPWAREDDQTWAMIGECLFNLGQWYKASTAFDRSFDLSKDEKFKNLQHKRAEFMREIAIKNPV